MISCYALESVPPAQGVRWDAPGYYDDAIWVVTYQRNEHSPIETIFEGSKLKAIAELDKQLEIWA